MARSCVTILIDYRKLTQLIECPNHAPLSTIIITNPTKPRTFQESTRFSSKPRRGLREATWMQQSYLDYMYVWACVYWIWLVHFCLVWLFLTFFLDEELLSYDVNFKLVSGRMPCVSIHVALDNWSGSPKRFIIQWALMNISEETIRKPNFHS